MQFIDPYKNEIIQEFKNKPPLIRLGGKKYLADTIVPRINELEYSLYIEPFFGGGRIYFEKDPHFAEIINDKEKRVSNFFFCARHFSQELTEKQHTLVKDQNEFNFLFDYHKKHYEEICEALSENRILWMESKDPEEKENAKDFLLNHAIEYFFLANMGFHGFSHIRSMMYFENDPRTETNRMRWRIFRPLSWIGNRMKRTQVLNKDFEEIFKIALKYDNHSRFWYLDPPYWKTQGYEIPFPWEKYEALSELLKSLPKTDYFILSLNNHEEINELFSWCKCERVKTLYSSGVFSTNEKIENIFTPPWKPNYKVNRGNQISLQSFLTTKEPGEKNHE